VLRYINGNPFRPAPAGLPAFTVQLAKEMYADADVVHGLHHALAEIGQEELAGHFWVPGAHPKGCWALDVILGKTCVSARWPMTDADWVACDSPLCHIT
jgi:hypothetical protein